MKSSPSPGAVRTAITILLLRILAEPCVGLSSKFRRPRVPNCWRSDMKNFAGSVSSRQTKVLAPRLALDVMFGTWGKSTGVCWLSAVAVVTTMQASIGVSDFRFDRDTLAFQNATVL